MHLKKILAATAIASAAIMSLAGCSSSPDLNPSNVMSDDWDISYLKVNEKSVVCYVPDSDAAAACEWHDVTIPNGVEVHELTNDNPKSDAWKLSYIVTVNNETVPCVSQYRDFGSCDFKTNASDGGYGESAAESEAPSNEPSTQPSVNPSANSKL